MLKTERTVWVKSLWFKIETLRIQYRSAWPSVWQGNDRWHPIRGSGGSLMEHGRAMVAWVWANPNLEGRCRQGQLFHQWLVGALSQSRWWPHTMGKNWGERRARCPVKAELPGSVSWGIHTAPQDSCREILMESQQLSEGAREICFRLLFWLSKLKRGLNLYAFFGTGFFCLDFISVRSDLPAAPPPLSSETNDISPVTVSLVSSVLVLAPFWAQFTLCLHQTPRSSRM